MKQAFLEYLGDMDSLAGYRRSNRLILLKSFFALVDKSGKAAVFDVVKKYKSFYQRRKEEGLIVDVGADIVIENTERPVYSEVLLVIKRHPYRVLNEKGYMHISRIDGQDFFVLNEALHKYLSDKDIKEINYLLDKKIDLYYSQIDTEKDTSKEKKDPSEIKIESAFIENYYLEFREYCRECNMVFVSEIEPVDLVAFRIKINASHELIKQIRDRLNKINKGEYKLLRTETKITNIKEMAKNTTAKFIQNTEENTLVVDRKNELDIKNNNAYSDPRTYISQNNYNTGLLISNVFSDGIFNKFNQFCIDNKFIYIKDLEGFDFNKLYEQRGFGKTKVNKVIERYNEVVTIDIPSNPVQNQRQRCLISERVRIKIEDLIQYGQNIEMPDDLTKDELFILNKAKCAVEELGIDMCQLAYLYPRSISLITNEFEKLEKDANLEDERRKKLFSVFKNICNSNKIKKVYPLIRAYAEDDIRMKLLLDIFSNCSTVAELIREFKNISRDNIYTVEALKFLKWLHTNLEESALNSCFKIFDKDNYKKVIYNRAHGSTLEEVGQLLGVSRERIRQMEQKVQTLFDSVIIRTRIMWLLSASLNGKTIITREEVSDYLRNNANEIIYLLINSKSNYFDYSKELDLFIISDQVNASKLDSVLDELPEIIISLELDNIIEQTTNEFKIESESIKRAVESKYRVSGQVYHKRKISLAEMYNIVLQRYYPTGMKLFEKTEHDRFRRHIEEMFGDVKLPQNNRAVDARVASIGILCDRGTYIHPDYIKIENNLIEEIKDYIKKGLRNSYTFLEIFEHFKDQLLLDSNVNNRYFLQGILKYHYNREFYFTRDMISKTPNIESLDDQIEMFVSKYDIVTKDQLRKNFAGITEAMLLTTISRCKAIITIENGEYMHIRNLNIIEADYEISKVISNLIFDMPVSSRKLLEVLFLTHSDFLSRNQVFSHIKLFSVIQYMFRNKYKFSRPFIAKQDTEEITKISIVKNYLNGRDYYEISELIEFCELNLLKFLSWSSLIDNLSDEYIRVDSGICVNIDQLDIDEKKIESIKNILKDVISSKGYISARKITDFMFYPPIGINWNGYVLKSIVEKYISEIEVFQIPTSDTYLLSGVFLKDDCGFDSYEELLRFILKSEHRSAPFKNLDEVRQWLQDEELINSNIPKFMLDNNYLYEDEFGKIIVE